MSIVLAVPTTTRNVNPETAAAATVLTEQTLVAYSSGKVIPATASTTRREIAGVVYKNKATTTADIKVDVEDIIPGSRYLVNTKNNTNVAHNGQRMILQNAGTVDNTGTDAAAGIVIQREVVGAAADKLAIVEFV